MTLIVFIFLHRLTWLYNVLGTEMRALAWMFMFIASVRDLVGLKLVELPKRVER
jgi:hypothetical protein